MSKQIGSSYIINLQKKSTEWKMSPHDTQALNNRRGWAWIIGVLPLASLYMFNGDHNDEQRPQDTGSKPMRASRRKAETDRNTRFCGKYEIVKQLFSELNASAFVDVKIPKTLSAFRREAAIVSRIERDYYNQFLPNGIAIAETLIFASRFGIWQFVSEEGSNDAHKILMNRYREGALRASIEFSLIGPRLSQYFAGDISAVQMVDEATEEFLDSLIVKPLSKFWNSLKLSPNISGIGIDLKQLMGR